MSEQFDHGLFQGMVLERLDNLKKTVTDGIEKLEQCQEEHGKRLRDLEDTRTTLKAWAAVIGAASGLLAHKAMAYFPLLNHPKP